MEKFVIKTKDNEEELYDSENSSLDDEDFDDQTTVEDSEELSNNGIKDAVDPLTFFTSKELCYYRTIHNFFKKCNDNEIIRMLNIINGESHISLRVLDWFVTRYSKRKIDFNDTGDNTIDSFDVHISYKSELKSYKKKYFDPFRRRKKFYYPLYLKELTLTKDNCTDSQNSKDLILLYTTLGQLNFFVWAITNKIIDYVEKNLDQISKAMNTNNKDEKKKKKKIAIVKKKEKSSEPKTKKENKNNVFNNYYEEDENNQLILDFD